MTIKICEANTGATGPAPDYYGGYFELHLVSDPTVRAYASMTSNLSKVAPFQIPLDEKGIPVFDLWVDDPTKYNVAFYTRDGVLIEGGEGTLDIFLGFINPGPPQLVTRIRNLEIRVSALEGPPEP